MTTEDIKLGTEIGDRNKVIFIFAFHRRKTKEKIYLFITQTPRGTYWIYGPISSNPLQLLLRTPSIKAAVISCFKSIKKLLFLGKL